MATYQLWKDCEIIEEFETNYSQALKEFDTFFNNNKESKSSLSMTKKKNGINYYVISAG